MPKTKFVPADPHISRKTQDTVRTSITTANEACSPSAVQPTMKRPRGRPRKYPLTTSTSTQMDSGSPTHPTTLPSRTTTSTSPIPVISHVSIYILPYQRYRNFLQVFFSI